MILKIKHIVIFELIFLAMCFFISLFSFAEETIKYTYDDMLRLTKAGYKVGLRYETQHFSKEGLNKKRICQLLFLVR